jgi:hypothetical protein
MADDLLRTRRFTVTREFLRTPRKTYALRDIDYVQVKRPVFILCVVLGGLLLAWAAVFWDVLYPVERIGLLTVVGITVTLSSRLGLLIVHSRSLRGGELEDAIVWDIATVRRVRDALDRAMMERRPRVASEFNSRGHSGHE